MEDEELSRTGTKQHCIAGYQGHPQHPILPPVPREVEEKVEYDDHGCLVITQTEARVEVREHSSAGRDVKCGVTGVGVNRKKQLLGYAGFYPSMVKRYFTSYFASANAIGSGSEVSSISEVCGIRILFHSNKLCVITLSPAHPVLSNKSQVIDVNFQVTDKCNRFLNTVSGKRKRGAQWLNPESAICIVTTSDDQVYVIRSSIRGSLIEVNDKLHHSPYLLTKMPETEGYIAIVMVKIDETKQIIEGLMDKVGYEKHSMWKIVDKK